MKKKRFRNKIKYQWLIADILLFASCMFIADRIAAFLGFPFLSTMFRFSGNYFYELFQSGGSVSLLTILVLIILVMVLILFLIVAITLLLTFPIIAIYYGIRSAVRRNQLVAITFESIQDIEYFRDAWKDLSPSTISLLMNLKLETKKDKIATLLSLEQKKCLTLEDGLIQLKNSQDTILTDSERKMLDILKTGRMNNRKMNEWEQTCVDEAVKNGFIKYNKDKKRFFLGVARYIIAFVICMMAFSYSDKNSDRIGNEIDEIMAPYEQAADKENMTLEEEIKLLEKELAAPGMARVMLLLAIMMACIFAMLCLFILPIAFLVYIISYFKSAPRFKRTHKGKLYTEEIAGMKNFIHDYSNLSQAEKEQIALWDEFLVYAVVLEENEKIVHDISKMRKIDLSGYEKLSL